MAPSLKLHTPAKLRVHAFAITTEMYASLKTYSLVVQQSWWSRRKTVMQLHSASDQLDSSQEA